MNDLLGICILLVVIIIGVFLNIGLFKALNSFLDWWYLPEEKEYRRNKKLFGRQKAEEIYWRRKTENRISKL